MTSPTGSLLSEAQDFLARHPEVQAVDIVLTDAHGIGRGKIIRRHELESLYTQGRGMPASLFAQDISGDDVEGALATQNDGGGDSRCWPVPGTLGLIPATGRGVVLVSMFADHPQPAEPRNVLMAQIARAEAMGFTPMGAMELEFYLVDRERDAQGRVQPARYPLTGRQSHATNTMSVDELDEMSPFFDAVYEGGRQLGLPMESLISEYAAGQYELTLRYRDLARAADDIILAKRLLRATARRFGMEACFMAKPFGARSGSGMHLHLSLTKDGQNLFSTGDLMLQAIGGIRAHMAETMLVLAPFLNSWRRFASTVYSPASNTWGEEDRNVALRIPAGSAKTRHFEHRVAGVDANPYLVAAVTLGTALDGIKAKADPGPAGADDDRPLPANWAEAIGLFETSDAMKRILGPEFHAGFLAIKRAEYDRLAIEVTDVEWSLYGFTV
ncbi:glutamine synthetase family protein [Rhodobacter sp. KR11]|uniref:glutamine synthetase family protein n=1 Tax=Rhodobacter sp. KR11 TaxID=2974588 RepID=UPI0022216AC8|nr:glutamine synthetase family protein [Rhodobacter sp. KR11]MCW1919281.1 glutamine synthetase family protein [Rhodobacter sp. KR11]